MRNSKYSSLRSEGGSTLFLPYFQSTGLSAMFVVVRTSAGPGTAERLTAAVAEVDPDIPATGLKTLSQQIDQTIGNERALGTLLGFFGLFAVVLAAIGLHGVTSHGVARRTGEIGIRMALGAQRRDVVWLILRQVVVLAAGGLVLGLPAAALLSRPAEALLFEVTPADPWSLALGGAALVVTAVLAGYIPARRASRLDPSAALRQV